MKHSSDDERGQAIVIVAFAMVVLLLFAALAIDGGNAYVERRRSQNAADAAALAGARQIWIQRSVPNADGTYDSSEINLLKAIDQAAVSNGVAGPTSGVNPNVQAYYTTNADGSTINPNQIGTLGFIPPNVTGIRVKAIREFGQNFGGLLRQSPNASAQATAVIVQPPPCSAWAIFATASQSCPPAHVSISGGGRDIHITNGGVYSNGTMQCDTSKALVDPPYAWEYNGGVTNGQCSTGNGSRVVQGSEPIPQGWNFDDFQPGGPVQAALGANYHVLSGDINSDGLYFTTGDARHINIGPGAQHVTIVAGGEIQFSGGINLSPYYNGLLLFSNQVGNAAIKISGSGLNWQGMIYAPNGSVDMSAASNVSIGGSILSACADLSGAGININYDPGSCVPQRATVKLLKFGE
jgi:hypothetical protein